MKKQDYVDATNLVKLRLAKTLIDDCVLDFHPDGNREKRSVLTWIETEITTLEMKINV